MQRPLEITPRIQAFPTRTPTLPPATHTNSYALGGRDLLLVEPSTPYGDEQRAFVQWARSLESAGRRLVAIFLTHHHPDHAGGAQVFSRELGLPLWAHQSTAERLPKIDVARFLEDGERIVLDGHVPERWDVLHTPGHAPGHLCLHHAASHTLVAGDMVASEGTIIIEPTDGDMGEYIAQLERLRALGATLALPAHGAPITEPGALFAQYVAHRSMREAKIIQALSSFGAAFATIPEIVPRAYDDAPAAVWPLAHMTTAAHLTKLVREGKVRQDGERYFAEESVR